MPLQEQVVDVLFAGGIDEQRDDRHVEPGRLITSQNIRFDKELGLRHRQGSSILSSTSDGLALNAQGRGMLLSRKDELLCVDGVALHGYSADKGAFARRDAVSVANISQEVVSGGSTGSFAGDCASSTTDIMYVWSDVGASAAAGGFMYYSIRNITTGNESASGRISMSTFGWLPRVTHIGSGVFVATYSFGANIVATTFTPPVGSGTWTVAGLGNVVTDNSVTASAGRVYALTNALAGQYVISYQRSSDTHVKHSRFTGASLTDSADQPEAGTVKGIATCYAAGEFFWYAYRISTGDVLVGVVQGLLGIPAIGPLGFPAVVHSPGAVLNTFEQIGICRYSSSQAILAFSQRETGTIGNNGQSVLAFIVNSSLAASTKHATHWASLTSFPFVRGTKAYAWMSVGVPFGQKSSILGDLRIDDNGVTSHARPQAQTAMRTTNDPSTATTTTVAACNAPAPTAGTVVALVSDLRALAANGFLPSSGGSGVSYPSIGRYNYSAVTADFTDPGQWIAAETQDSAVLSGGVPSFYDGHTLGECGFYYSPDGAAQADGGGGSLAAGTYFYVYTYVSVDSSGQAHESQPSLTYSFTSAASHQIAHTIPSYCPTLRHGDTNTLFNVATVISVNIYRSTLAAPAGPFYLVVNDATRVFVRPDQTLVTTYIDNATDAAIVTQPQLYTGRISSQSTILDNVSPPSLSSIVEHKGRLFGIDPSGKNIWFTKLAVSGEATGSKWCDEFTVPHTGPGKLLALASMDDKLIAFTRDRIYMLQGDGPTDGLLNNDYNGLTRITSDVGCIRPNSTALTDDGLYFMSNVGVYMLTRGLEVQWIGRPVQDTASSFPYASYALVHPSSSYVLFGLTAAIPSVGAQGIRLVWDDNVKAWTKDLMLDGVRTDGAATLGSVRIGGDLYWLDTHGVVYHEDTTGAVFTEGGAFVPLSIEMAWVKTAGIQGFQRVWRASLLGDKKSPHDLTMSIGTDYQGYTQAHTFTWLTNINGVALEQLRLRLVRQLCQAVRVKLVTSQAMAFPVGTGESLSLQGVSFEVGVNKHMLPVAAGKSA